MSREGDITIAQLKAFFYTVEEGSYTRAAARLGISQPGVSHSIASLEKSLGECLILKSGSSIMPSEIGRAVHTSAKKILLEIGTIHANIESMRASIDMSLRLASIPSVTKRILKPFIEVFSTRYPKSIGLTLDGVEEEVKDWVESGIVDIGITTDTTKLNLPYWEENFDWVALFEDEILVIMPEDHELSKFSGIDLTQVSQYPLIMPSGGCEALIHNIFFSAVSEKESFQVDFWVRDTTTLLDMVAADVGISLVPKLALQGQEKSGIVAKSMDPVVQRTIIAFWPKRHPPGKIGDIFIRQLKK
ncbi:LysR family transcriptional regulator [Halomonas daqingensis]|uniref:LysR family transcriptional regulator n=1 Tax=Billgrantia desiderata TaxID=52021 RepID=UPI001F346F2A|nr:LysR family transcriptional regulator [Halomonas desiderata]MCE8027712.1 LysR family transcriptional regulator [Halomonas desiderata]